VADTACLGICMRTHDAFATPSCPSHPAVPVVPDASIAFTLPVYKHTCIVPQHMLHHCQAGMELHCLRPHSNKVLRQGCQQHAVCATGHTHNARRWHANLLARLVQTVSVRVGGWMVHVRVCRDAVQQAKLCCLQRTWAEQHRAHVGRLAQRVRWGCMLTLPNSFTNRNAHTPAQIGAQRSTVPSLSSGSQADSVAPQP
jgi:hypothetical protein